MCRPPLTTTLMPSSTSSPGRSCSRWQNEFHANTRLMLWFFRASLVSRRVTYWEGRSPTPAAPPSSALSSRSPHQWWSSAWMYFLLLFVTFVCKRCVGFPTWTLSGSGGRGWRETPGATRRCARRCSGWQLQGDQGQPEETRGTWG